MMSTATLTRAEVVQKAACPECYAEAGKACEALRSSVRAVLAKPHKARAQRAAGHVPTFSRYSRGRTVIGNRPLWGYTITCTCGWKTRVNGTEREAMDAFNAHATVEVTP